MKKHIKHIIGDSILLAIITITNISVGVYDSKLILLLETVGIGFVWGLGYTQGRYSK